MTHKEPKSTNVGTEDLSQATPDSNGAAKELEDLFKILDEYYVLKNPDDLGVEPEHKIIALIEQREAEARIDELTDLLLDKTNRRNGQIKVWSVRDRVTALKEARSD